MDVQFTARELDIMAVLWDLGSGTVAEVRRRLEDELAYTTVLTVLQTLEEKGHVAHQAEGKAYRYIPRVKREEAGQSALRRLTQKVFSGSPELLVTQLVSNSSLSEEELLQMRRLLNARLREMRE